MATEEEISRNRRNRRRKKETSSNTLESPSIKTVSETIDDNISLSSVSTTKKSQRRKKNKKISLDDQSLENSYVNTDDGGGGGIVNECFVINNEDIMISSSSSNKPKLEPITKKHHKKHKRSLHHGKKRTNSDSKDLELLNELEDDILSAHEDDKGGENFDYATLDIDFPSSTYSNFHQNSSISVSQPTTKIYIEKSGGFSNVSKKKVSQIPIYNNSNNSIRPSSESGGSSSPMTPLELSLQSQKIFRSIGIFSHGLLAGLAFWQLVMVYVLAVPTTNNCKDDNGDQDMMGFITLYSPLSQPLHLIFYLLTVICTISIYDRYDIAQMNLKELQSMLTLKSGGLAVVVYAVTLILTLATTRLDDKLSLHQYNSTLFIDKEVLANEMDTWKSLNLCRSVAVIFGWIIVSIKPGTDKLYKHLNQLSDYHPTN